MTAFEGARLLGALYLSRTPVAVAREWVTRQFSASHADPRSRFRVVAGRGGVDRPDAGAVVCSRFGIGINQIAMAAALGVSLTHRDHARSVRLVTGHSRHGGLPDDLDWRAPADPAATTAFYMGGRTGGEIAKRLIGLGLAPGTPVAVAFAVGRPEQSLMSIDLARLASEVLAPAGGRAARRQGTPQPMTPRIVDIQR